MKLMATTMEVDLIRTLQNQERKFASVSTREFAQQADHASTITDVLNVANLVMEYIFAEKELIRWQITMLPQQLQCQLHQPASQSNH